jgi:hypothetical protein
MAVSGKGEWWLRDAVGSYVKQKYFLISFILRTSLLVRGIVLALRSIGRRFNCSTRGVILLCQDPKR